MLWAVIAAAAAAALILLTGVVCFFIACLWGKRFDYHDEKILAGSAYKHNLPELTAAFGVIDAMETERLQITSFDGTVLTGHLLDVPDAGGSIILFHGFRSCWQVDFACQIPLLRSLGLRVLAVDMRAHQESGGKLLTYGVKERKDAACWVEALNGRFGTDSPVFLYGISMGSATAQMACGLSLPENVRGLIADCGYSSPYAILRTVLKNMFHLPACLLMPVVSASAKIFGGFGLKEASGPDAMRQSGIPALFIHGTADRLVPCEMSRESCDACAAPKELLTVEGAGHALSYYKNRSAYEQALTALIRRGLGKE